ncbi:MAG: DUF4230 domain-containing protein, partial [Bacteroidota bacterium]|nr:DUF4230 domain-containing protein [Bacteroidota bacterium]
MRKILQKYLVIAASILLILFLLQKINWIPSFKNIFASQPIVIEETPIIIKEVNTLSQLITVTYADEIVMDETKQGNGMPSLMAAGMGMILVPSTDKLVMIGRGKVLAGMDLKILQDKDVNVTRDSIHITLPAAKILNTVINPSGFEIFDEKGDWKEDEVIALKIKVKDELTKRALQQNILG